MEAQKRIGRVAWTLVIIWPLAWLILAAMSPDRGTYAGVAVYGSVLFMLVAALFGCDDPDTRA